MFEFFGCIFKILVSDNCTTAVNRQQSEWHTPSLNTTYYEMAEHYETVIIPAKVRNPKTNPMKKILSGIYLPGLRLLFEMSSFATGKQARFSSLITSQ